MKLFFVPFILFAFDLKAQVSRAPAVLAEKCDLDISTSKIKKGTEKSFKNSINHQVIIHSSGEDLGCSILPKKRFPDSIYEQNVRNEINILFEKYPETYAKKCTEYFKHLGLKSYEFTCDKPAVLSMTFKGYECEKKIEEGTHKISYAAVAKAEVQYSQVGNRLEEKSVEEVQKEECKRVNECIGQAEEKDLPELKKLAAVACRVELTPVSTANAPEAQKDSSFDGNRKPKIGSDGNKVSPQKNSSSSESVIK